MSINFRNYLEKLQNLPETQKKIILWTIVAVLAIGMAYFWLREASDGLNKMGEVASKIEFPKVSPEALNALNTIKTNIEGSGDQAAPIDESWQTYTNNKYGFEFKYPDGEVVESGGACHAVFCFNGSDTSGNFNVSGSYSSSISPTASKIIINNHTAQRMEENGATYYNISIDIQGANENDVWTITGSVSKFQNESDEEYNQSITDIQGLVDGIASTFKFVK